MRRLKSLSIDCDCQYSRKEDCYCATIVSQSAVNLEEIRNLKLSRHVLKKSDIQLKAFSTGLKQLTHLTLEQCIYEDVVVRKILANLNHLSSLVVHGWCIHWFTGSSLEAIYSMRGKLLYHKPSILNCLPPTSSCDLDLNLTSLAGCLTKLNKLQHLEISSTCIDYQEAKEISTAITSHPSLQSLHLSMNRISNESYDLLITNLLEREVLFSDGECTRECANGLHYGINYHDKHYTVQVKHPEEPVCCNESPCRSLYVSFEYEFHVSNWLMNTLILSICIVL